MKKKLCAGLLVTSMILSSSVMAFAASGDSTSAGILSGSIQTVSDGNIITDQTIKATTVVDPGVINVDIPSSAKIILNPYAEAGGRQVLSTIMPFKNYGNVGIKLKISKLEASLASQASMLFVDETTYNTSLKDVTATQNGKPTGVGPALQDIKFGTLYLESAVLSETAARVLTGSAADKKLDVVKTSLTGSKKIPSTEIIAVSKNQENTWGTNLGVPVTATPITSSDSPVIVGGLSNTATDSNITTNDTLLLSDSIAFLRFNGGLNPYVTWTENDSVTAEVVFRLQPAVVTTADSLYQKSK